MEAQEAPGRPLTGAILWWGRDPVEWAATSVSLNEIK